MKKTLCIFLIMLTLFSLFGCSKPDITVVTGESEILPSKLENMAELRKNVFICKILSVDEKEALIPKYNVAITNYTVYTVEVTESLDGYTPLSQIEVYCMGTSDEFLSRIALEKNESYILDAEPWVYGDKIIYLLPIYTAAFPKIDTAGRITLAQSDTKAVDCGSLEDYKKSYLDAKESLKKRLPDFYSSQEIYNGYKEIFQNIQEKNADNWFREFDYEFVPSDDFIKQTRQKTDAVYTYIDSLAQKETVTDEDIKSIFIQ